MNRNFSILALASMIAGMDNSFRRNYGDNNLTQQNISIVPKEKPIPKGCNRFYFNETGECEKGKHNICFDAMKKSSAIKKWKKYLTNL